ncbi:MAG: MutS2/Smr-associated SH3 domain-containing protein, partial [Flavobacteriales bacterium]
SAGNLAGQTIDEYEGLRKRLEEKIQKQQETIEKNNKFLQQGRKLVQFIESYNLRTKNKELLEDVKKYIAMEKAKLEDVRKQKAVQSKVKKQREEKIAVESNRDKITIGSLVRLRNTKQTGTVLSMDKGVVMVAIGMFKTKVDLQKLDFIQ